MDSEIVRCPQCGKSNKVPAGAAGKTVVCGNCKTPLTAGGGGHPATLTDAGFRSAIASGSHIVDFWAAWCGPCRMIAPILEEIASQRSDVRVGKLNVDENPRTAAQFNVQSIPLLVFFKDGVERGRVVGAVPRQRIESAIAEYLS